MSSDATPSTDAAPDEERKAPPVFRQQFGAVTLSIWTRQTNDGTRCWYEYSLKRSFRDDQQNWKNTYSYRPDDSGDLQLAIFTALRWIRTEGKARSIEFAKQHGNDHTTDDIPF